MTAENHPQNCMECPKNPDNCTLCNPIIAEGEEFIQKYGHGIIPPSNSSKRQDVLDYWERLGMPIR